MNHLFLSPLEQFKIVAIIPLFNSNFVDMSFTNSTLALLLNFLVLFFITTMIGSGNFIPNRWETLKELVLINIRNILNGSLGGTLKSKMVYLPLLLTFGINIVLSNTLSMFPYSFAVTSHLIITLFLATVLFVPITGLAIKKHGVHSLSFFYPSGAPFPLVFLLVPIEATTYVFRVISLSVRLFANIMAGHILLKVLAGFAWSMFLSPDSLIFSMHLLPVTVVTGLFGLELGVAFIQAYVWLMLTCIYLNDAIYLH
jgi:F-type H+-transporting ATPase subunit a